MDKMTTYVEPEPDIRLPAKEYYRMIETIESIKDTIREHVEDQDLAESLLLYPDMGVGIVIRVQKNRTERLQDELNSLIEDQL